MAVRSRSSQVLLLLGAVVVLSVLLLADCGASASAPVVGATPTSAPSLRTVGTFQGSGDGQTVNFVTGEPWVLVWSCNPVVYGTPAPFRLIITDETPDSAGTGPKLLDIRCQSSSTHGLVAVRQTGDQWLAVATGGSGGLWALEIQVTTSDVGATVLLTPLPPTPPPPTTIPRPSPTPAALPLMLAGSGDNLPEHDLFTTAVRWHLSVICTAPPQQQPYFNELQVDRIVSYSPVLGYQVQAVGEIANLVCDGQSVDSDQSTAAGFAPGTYWVQMVTQGSWTITIAAF